MNKRRNGLAAGLMLVLLLIFTSGCNKNVELDGAQTSAGSHEECLMHSDADDNGLCDVCSTNVIVVVDFYAINDIHGKFADSSSQPGVDELTTYLKDRMQKDDNTVFIASGDFWQGSTESNQTKGEIFVDWMNELGFVSMTLGNHEFDWGVEKIIENQEKADFPFLALNIYNTADNSHVDYCSSSVIVEKDGVKIGIIGAIGDCYSSIASDMTKGVYFAVKDDLTELVKKESEKLRAEGCRYIVYSLHDGSDDAKSTAAKISDSAMSGYYDTALSDGYVDLVFEAHTHQPYVVYDRYGVYHLQNGGENKSISHVEVQINKANSNNKVTEAEIVQNSIYSAYESDSIRDELLKKYDDVISEATRTLGTNAEDRESNVLADLAAQAYYMYGQKRWGSDYEIALGGAFFNVRNPYILDAGEVNYSQLQSLFPFDNEVVLVSMKGEDLKRVFYESPNSRYAMYYGEYGQSIKNSIDPDAVYYVITDTYSSTYAPNKMTEIERAGEGSYARDLIANMVSAGALEKSVIPGAADGKLVSEEETQVVVIDSDITNVNAVGAELASGAVTSENYRLKGTVAEITNEKYGNFYLKDEVGNTILIYGIKNYSKMTEKIQVGDTVTVIGPVTNYKGTAELKNVEIIIEK